MSLRNRPLSFAVVTTLTALTVGLHPVAAGAEEASDSPIRPGAWAVEFALNPSLFYFGPVSGSTIAVRRHRSARSALRLGLSAAFDESNRDGESSNERFDTTANPNFLSRQGDAEGHSEYHSYALFLQLHRRHPVREAVAVFWEMGPSFRYSESKNFDGDLYPYLSVQETLQSYRSYTSRSVSIDLNFGFEWFFKRRLSLGARLGAWSGYSWGSESTTYETFTSDNSYYSRSARRTDVKEWNVQTSSTTVALTVYL